MEQFDRGRIQSEHNQHLSRVLSVFYGAVLSYGMYVLAQLIVRLWRGHTGGEGVGLLDFGLRLVVFMAVMVFMAEDVAEIVKLDACFPQRRTSRYTHELVIGSFYVVTFAMIDAGSYLAVTAFGFAVAWGGVWCNQFKEEYAGDPSHIDKLAKAQRSLQYTGGLIFIGQSVCFVYLRGNADFGIGSTLAFVASFVVWMLAYQIIPAYWLGVEVLSFTVNCFVPDRLFSRAETLNASRKKED